MHIRLIGPYIEIFLLYRKLSRNEYDFLISDFIFFKGLGQTQQNIVEHRVATFLRDKQFVGREGLEVTGNMKVLIAAVGCMLSFGRRNYSYRLVDHILIYPNEFYSNVNECYHKGEFNPKEKVIVFSWKAFEEGHSILNDNLNVGIHEFMHAMQLEASTGSDLDSSRFLRQFQNILKQLARQETKDRLVETRYFRNYAFTNQYEFMAVLAEYFIESPAELKRNFPILYDCTKKLLNFRFAEY